MRLYKKWIIGFTILVISLSGMVLSCTKIEKGYLSPYVQYGNDQFDFIRGRVNSSASLMSDGTSMPFALTWTHIYDSAGNIVDSIFSKTYPVALWTATLLPTDTSYAQIMAKQSVQMVTPLTVNPTNGTIVTNAGSLNIPVGTYYMDMKLSNGSGSELLDSIMELVVLDGKPLEMAPEQGSFENQIALYGQAGVAETFSKAANNPFDAFTVTRLADTPNVLIVKVTDRNGVPFDFKKGEITRRPATGLNPIPAYLQNLQNFQPDTYVATDTGMSLRFPATPWPIIQLPEGENNYYNIQAPYVTIDSTSAWDPTQAGMYQGITDPHYLGTFQNGEYDYFLRFPLVIQVPGTYEVVIRILNVTHK